MELEVGILDGWMRYWFRGKLVPLPPELDAELEATREKLARSEAELAKKSQRIADLERQLSELKAKLEGN